MAGLDSGDRILELDGRRVRDEGTVEVVLARHSPGDVVPLVYEQRGHRLDGRVTLGADIRLTVVPLEAEGGRPTAEQRRLRQAWLGSRVRAVIRPARLGRRGRHGGLRPDGRRRRNSAGPDLVRKR